MDVLVDTSVWFLSLRRHSDALNKTQRTFQRELERLVMERRARIIGSIRQEVLSAVRETSSFERLKTVLRAFPDVPLDAEDYEDAAAVMNRCLAAGIAASSVDSLICAAALRRRLSVLTTDTDFARYARFLPLQLHAPREADG